MAESLLQTGHRDEAMKYATMGVAIGQQLNRCKGYYDKVQVEAGSVDCRLIRARVRMDERRWQAAEKEIRLAKTLSQRSSYKGWINAVAAIESELASRRTK